MNEFFADLHVHIGRAENNKPIKITAARSLNFANIAKECEERKGIKHNEKKTVYRYLPEILRQSFKWIKILLPNYERKGSFM